MAVVISTKNDDENFNTFIKLENNQRMLFTAPFGMGKTYFLNEFFKINSEEYNTFHLYPIRYQVHNDVNIIKVIAADLFVQLTNKHKNAVESFFNEENIKLKKKHIRGLFMKCLGSLPSPLIASETLITLEPTTFSIIKELFKNQGIFDNIKQFFKNETELKYHSEIAEIYNNFLEDSIIKILEKINNGKKNVLVLDDLDRLEPKHVFKILNAFSPLFDKENNKFGFDKIIFVGDFDNLKNIYHNVYGNGANFDAYINKFSSIGSYQYNIEKEVSDNIKKIISEYCHTKKESQIQAFNHEIHSIIELILLPAFRAKKINLRNLLMPQKNHFLTFDVSQDSLQTPVKRLHTKIIIKILLLAFSNNKKELLDAINIAKKDFINKIKPYHDHSFNHLFELRHVMAYMHYVNFLSYNDPDNLELVNEEIMKKRKRDYFMTFNNVSNMISTNDNQIYKKNIFKAIEIFFNALYEYVEKEVYKDDRFN